jgi:hypothetical protein
MRNADGTSSDWYASSALYTPLNDSSPPQMPAIAQHRTTKNSTNKLNPCNIPTDSCTFAENRPSLCNNELSSRCVGWLAGWLFSEGEPAAPVGYTGPVRTDTAKFSQATAGFRFRTSMYVTRNDIAH